MSHQTLPVPRDVPSNLFNVKSPLIGKVLSCTRLSAAHRAPLTEACHVVISCPGFSYVSGQSAGVVPPGVDVRTGRPYALRLYSIASCGRGDDRKGDTLSLVVARHFWNNPQTGDRDIPGVCSHHLCDAKPGDELRLTGPVGKRFLLPVDFMERDFVFIATGTGIAPFRAMLADMFDAGYGQQQGRRVTLVLGVPYEDSILYDEELRQLQAANANFTYVTAVSRGSQVNRYPDLFPTRDNKVYAHIAMWDARDVVSASLLKPGTVAYYCGLRGMETGIEAVINHVGREAGVEDLVKEMIGQGRLLREVY